LKLETRRYAANNVVAEDALFSFAELVGQ